VSAQRGVIACRYSSYGSFSARVYEHVAAAGLRHVEIMVPPSDGIDVTSAALRAHDLMVSSMHGECDIARPGVGERVAALMPAFNALGCELMFASVQRGELPREAAYARLREAGQAAGAHGVTIALETHPDLMTNAEVALETMRGVDHPHVRMNFDTANLYFYNRGTNCVAQLRRVVQYVAAVHLKDTDGGYQHWHFPALGEGMVDFAGVFEVLDQAGYHGPCTLEIEGIEGEEKTEQLVCERVLASVDYLRKLNRV
jgi:sugar phosphate isomerase/epimerase